MEALITATGGIGLTVASAAAEPAQAVSVPCALLSQCSDKALLFVTDIVMTATSTDPVSVLLVDVTGLAHQLALRALDRGPPGLHLHRGVLVAHVVVAAVRAVLGAVALEHLAAAPVELALAARDRLAAASQNSFDPVH